MEFNRLAFEFERGSKTQFLTLIDIISMFQVLFQAETQVSQTSKVTEAKGGSVAGHCPYMYCTSTSDPLCHLPISTHNLWNLLDKRRSEVNYRSIGHWLSHSPPLSFGNYFHEAAEGKPEDDQGLQGFPELGQITKVSLKDHCSTWEHIQGHSRPLGSLQLMLALWECWGLFPSRTKL